MKIPVSTPSLIETDFKFVDDAIRSGWISGSKGTYIDKFESDFAAFCGVKYGVAASSGSTALHLATSVLDLSPEDEVIVPTFTNIATVLSVVYAGGKPVLVDSDPEIWGMDARLIERKITKKTRAIIPVHIYGHPVDMDEIMKLSKDYNLVVIEDGAEAHGAEYKGRKIGGIGQIGCFSFYANKIITTGEGGMVVTDDEQYRKKAKTLSNLAFSDAARYRHEYLGFNYRLSNVLAALGCSQLSRIEELVSTKRWMGERYNSLLRGIDSLQTPVEKSWAKNVYWMYGIVLKESFGMTRDELRNFLSQKGIETRAFFYPMHLQPAFNNKGLFLGEHYPVSEKLSNHGLYLPSGLTITNEEITYVTDCIIEASEQAPRNNPPPRKK
ncbi:MAG TPA: DegT/DnrJ/EryC1/StrS family aminotransferase [Nitrososphaerales archaeon]|nr:DegT/DnrJ/EryC1/StrS family aminotransferase [Nitrososphaerales archaeon]